MSLQAPLPVMISSLRYICDFVNIKITIGLARPLIRLAAFTAEGSEMDAGGATLNVAASLTNAAIDPRLGGKAPSFMALTIYGSPRSRTMRILWTAAELGLDYDHIPIAFDDPALKSAAFRRINPAGAIPAIVDDEFALAESLAINLYLCKKYGSGGVQPLYPATLVGEADVWRWTLWAQGHLEPWVQGDALLADVIAAIGDKAARMIDASLTLLDETLAGRRWLVADHFTVADLNVAAVLSPSRAAKCDLSQRPHVRDWLARCYARPAAVATRERFG